MEAGDHVYTKLQTRGLLPKSWSNSRKNVLIFNSSEDEYFSIGKDYDSNLFENQIEGIKFLKNFYKNYNDVDIYLRIHPNLLGITGRYHMDLCDLEGGNFYVIQADSPVSTYDLIDHSDLVVVFNSTVGIEAGYVHKNVVRLSAAIYDDLKIGSRPNSLDELNDILKGNKACNPTKLEDALAFGYFYSFDHGKSMDIIDTTVKKQKIFKKSFKTVGYKKILSSTWLYLAYFSLRTIFSSFDKKNS